MKNISQTLASLIIIIFVSCKKSDREYDYDKIDFKEEMRQFVINISRYSKQIETNFIVVPQNGVELVTKNGEENNNIHQGYLNAIDGQGQEELNYGYEEDNFLTPDNIHNHLRHFLDLEKNTKKTILITDYVTNMLNGMESYANNEIYGYTGFVALSRELDIIPLYIHHSNNNNITNLSQIKNFLYILNYHNFNSKQNFINRIKDTNYDLIIMDLYFNGEAFTRQEIESMRRKQNGGDRLLISYVSIGEAEEYRYYWQQQWNNDKPDWLEIENAHWQGNYKVKYWEKDWQDIIFGNSKSYINKVIEAGFDGVYLDIIDAFEYFETKYNKN